MSTFPAAIKIEAFDLREQPILFAEHLATEERHLARAARAIEGGPIGHSLNVRVGMLGRWLRFSIDVVDHFNRRLHVVSHTKYLQGVNEVIGDTGTRGKHSGQILLQMSSLSGKIGERDFRDMAKLQDLLWAFVIWSDDVDVGPD